MAKGNMLLGHARGKVGSLVFYRSNGKQITRARAEQVKNPKTNAQLIQRALTASVAQAYAAGKVIFDHSFEGKSVPSGSQREFMSRNMRQLRQDYAQDIINGGTTGALDVAAFVAPRATSPVPYSFIVSQGTLQQSLFTMADDSNDEYKIVAQMPAASEQATVADWAAANNLVAGDIYTIVALGAIGENTIIEDYGNAPTTQFGFIRLTVKPGLDSVTKLFSEATLEDVFSVDKKGTPIPASTLLSAPINIDQVVPSCLCGAMGVIRSREDSGLRSTCRLQVRGDITANNTAPWTGIKSTFVLDVWSAEAAKLGSSSLILEGGNF